MKHLGNIAQITGDTIAPVNVIIGGSPCQGLSTAGKRAGLADERSGLFTEQIRIVKEMRKKHGTDYPRFMVWENVPGALSSNEGEDFRIVLEEIAKIAEPDTVIPRPPKGKWRNSGCIVGDGWSIAWRILDAQFWGVPSVAVESRLWQILEESPHPKYYLSARACQGILRRASARGKELPELLRKALERQAASA